ncbi:MAG: CDGSH iron-sulfur domain-containing protein [Desertimonas sp.]
MAIKDDDGVSSTITPRRDGPLVVEGRVSLVGADGTEETHERLFLCRCGASGNKPMCDGTHKRIGFEASGVAPPPRST